MRATNNFFDFCYFFAQANKLTFQTTRLKYYLRYLEIPISFFLGQAYLERMKFSAVHLAFLIAKMNQ